VEAGCALPPAGDLGSFIQDWEWTRRKKVEANEGYAPSDSNAWTDGCGQLRESRVPGCVWGPANPEHCLPLLRTLRVTFLFFFCKKYFFWSPRWDS
jgi:hypothetical protein